MAAKIARICNDYHGKALQLFAFCTIILLIGSSAYPALAASNDNYFSNSSIESTTITPSEVSALNALAQSIAFANQRDSDVDIDALMAAIPINVSDENDNESFPELKALATNFSDINLSQEKYGPDKDGDGIPDSVELVLGTDINNTDSDFDQLDDLFEINNDLDPLKADSNDDGLADYFEIVNGTSKDSDGDGFVDAWDLDNDNDGVIDALDLSPFSRSASNESFDFNIQSSGNPTYLNFQIRPENPEHLNLLAQSWDWPDDSLATMKDLNSSQDDVTVTPMLELTVPVDCKIVSVDNGECIQIHNGSLDGEVNVNTDNYRGEDYQLWKLESADDNYYRIISKNNSKCLEVFNSSLDDMANVTVGNYTGEDNQLWELELGNDGFYKLISKHSEKCLEINSTNDTCIFQNSSQETDKQLWEIELVGGITSDPNALEEYGIVTTLDKAYISLSPVKDFGNIVALNGRMFYPKNSSLDTFTQARLVWIVKGQTDREKRVSLQANKGQYVSVDATTSELVARGISVTNNEIFEIVYLNNNEVALKTSNGKYVYVTDGGELIGNSTDIDEVATFELLDLEDNRIALKAFSGQYVCAEGGGGNELIANRDERKEWESFTLLTHEYESVSTTLAKYNENFMLTGFSVEENDGTNFGVFFSEETDKNENINRTVESAILLSYSFLRSQTALDQMPGKLQNDYNMTINSMLGYADHQDEALATITGEMTPDALSSLPDDEILPVIALFEDYFRTSIMDDINPGISASGNSFDIDLTDQPLFTTKSMKMTWYNTSTDKSVDSEDMLYAVQEWGDYLDEKTLATTMALMIIWETGETGVAKADNSEQDFAFKEALDVISTISYYGIGSLGVCLGLMVFGQAAYSAIKLSNIVPNISSTWGDFTWIYGQLKGVKSTGKTPIMKWAGKFNRWAEALDIAGMVLDIGLAIIAWIVIACEENWNGYGFALGGLYASLKIIYTLALYFIGLIPVIGWLIVGIILLSDLVTWIIFGKGWSDMIIDWIVGKFLGVNMITDADLKMLSTDVHIKDYKDNGLTEGDGICVESQYKGIITKGLGASDTKLKKSYIIPKYECSSLHTLSSNSSTTEGTTIYRDNAKETEYQAKLWVYPDATINFPFEFWLRSDYKIYYEKYVLILFWKVYNEYSDESTKKTDPSTLYFDVLPDDIESFYTWTAISSNDIDGDDILNSDELSNGTSQLRWDTDNDGLSDKYEIDYGTIPVNGDTDGDGLEDGLELRYGYDPLEWDTDGDGLNDFEEHRGWDIEFEFYDETFEQHVWSSPLNNDSDDDGLSDLNEFLKGLNPQSGDTNGNGILDSTDLNFTAKAYISNVDLNGFGSSIKTDAETNITAVIDYTLIGKKNSTGNASACWLFVSLDNSTLHEEIYNGTPAIGNETYGSATLDFSAPNSTDVFALRFYQTWNISQPAPDEDDRNLIGVIDTLDYPARRAGWVSSGKDEDRDGLIDINEEIGWSVTIITNYTIDNYTSITNYTDIGNYAEIHTIDVTSDPRFKDSDFDGLDDHTECYLTMNSSSNPESSDTDGDGLNDFTEYYLGTNLTNFDTDGDALDDSTEIFFGSDSLIPDTDHDGLFDSAEFYLSSNPLKVDTDNDGLTDLEEVTFGSDLLKPDSDDDGLFDDLEMDYLSNPLVQDTDGDGLDDGYEVHGTGTSPLLKDTDFDGLTDFEELEMDTNPLSADTDRDGYNDSQEMNFTTNPLLEDTDGDNLNDSLDMDSLIPNVRNITVAYDLTEDNEELLDTLGMYTNITVYSADELLMNHSDEPCILLLGKPEKVNGTAGNITYDVLKDDGDILPRIIDSAYDRIAVRYGVWNSTQTVVMLSEPYMYDHCRILDAFRSKEVTTSGNSIMVEYKADKDIFVIDSVDSIKRTDSEIGVVLDSNVTPWIKLQKSGSSGNSLTSNSGLASGEYALDKYIDITVSENVENTSSDIINGASVKIYYRSSELDRNGDGDTSDNSDIDEDTLCIYYRNTGDKKWTKLSDTSINTENVELYGVNYEGYVQARISHLSSFALAGELNIEDDGPLDSDRDGLPNIVEYRMGTDPFNPDTDGDGIIDSEDAEPLTAFRTVLEDTDTGIETPPEETEIYPVPQEAPLTKNKSVPGYLMWLIFVVIILLLSYMVIFKRKR